MMTLARMAMGVIAATGLQAGAVPQHLRFPVDWNALAPLPYRSEPQVTEQMSHYVSEAVRMDHCPQPQAVEGRYTLRVDVAVLLAADSNVRATIPRAIQCPMVEQYAAGLVSTMARNNLLPHDQDPSGWYRASVTFSWPV